MTARAMAAHWAIAPIPPATAGFTRREAAELSLEPPPSPVERSTVAAVIGVAVAALGVLVLVGWALDIGSLKSVLPGLVSMKVNTAVCFVLAGVSVGLLATGGRPTLRRAARLLAAVVLAVGTLTALQYLAGADLGIDSLLFREVPGSPETVVPGRMAPATAASFVMLGVALMAIDSGRRGVLVAQVLAVATLLVAGLALAGYVYDVSALYRIEPHTPMALHTALSFLGPAVALLVLHPNEGLMAELVAPGAGGAMARRLLPLGIGLALVLGGLWLIGERLGSYGTEFGVALFVTSMIALFSAGTWLIARGLNRVSDARRQALEDLRREVVERRRAETFLARVMDSASNSIIVLDRDGAIRLANRTAGELLQRSSDELSGLSFRSFIPDDGGDPARDLFDSAVAGRSGVIGEVTVVRGNGSKATVRAAYGPLLEDGVLAGSVVLAEDIGERRQLEARLREAERLEAVGRLAGGIAHDFNNLLLAINGFAQLALDRLGVDDPARTDVEEVLVAGERAASLTRQLLAFGRRQRLQPEVLDLGAATQALVPMLERLLGEDVELEVKVSPGLHGVVADRGQLEQVIVNLALNARDAMPNGGHVRIETANVTFDAASAAAHPGEIVAGDWVMLAVSDTGTGMDAQTLSRIFEPFFTTKEVGQGTGLGLATVYGIVRQSGGLVVPYSEPGRGSTFKVYLPVSARSPEAPATSPPRESHEGSGTILIAEDEPAVRELMRRVLTAGGYLVLAARDAGEALAVAEAFDGRIDLLISDLVLPGGASGHDLVVQLVSGRPETPCLYISGYAESIVGRDGALGPDEPFLAKPFSSDALLARVRQLLGQA